MKAARGQSLVLASLSMLLLVLLVLGTLGIGSSIKKKMELQTVADAAAHSRAALVARAFNLIARANRAQSAEMVASAGTQALISWSTLHLELLRQSEDAFRDNASFFPNCAPCRTARGAVNSPYCSCNCGDARARSQAAAQRLQAEAARVALGFDGLEGPAFAEEEAYRRSALELYKLESDALSDLATEATMQRISRDFMRHASVQDNTTTREWRAPFSQDGVSSREVSAAVEAPALDNTVALKLALGSRGAAFTTNRDGASAATQGRMNRLLGGVRGVSVQATLAGATYFADRRQHGDPANVSDLGLWSEDHGDVTARTDVFPNGPRPAPLPASCPDFIATRNGTSADVVTAMAPRPDNHRSDGRPLVEAAGRHVVAPCDCPLVADTFGSPGFVPVCPPRACVRSEYFSSLSHPAQLASALAMGQAPTCAPCPGVFPLFIRTKDPTPAADIFKQPKHYAILTRDPSRGPGSPWAVKFRMAFAGSGTLYDTTGDLDQSGAIDLRGLEHLSAIATSVTYYHFPGPGGWREEPNLFNPYWRATLSTPDIDLEGRTIDYIDTLDDLGGSPAGYPRQAWDALVLNGWKGLQ